MEQTTSGMIIIGMGSLPIAGALFNRCVVEDSGKLIPRLLGPSGARIFMIIVGVALIFLGAAILSGMV